uniref:vascular cell adhesion protein 1-like n=1 Tax=Doryrhamphus excisus TaxID=161450 RepID=UPI0025ADBF92|nr:vascular cell adhesion protein 1-like [Doryrhamphus excisus]
MVVEFGASASASCSVCQSACHNKVFGLEKSVGTEKRNGTTILWTVDKMDKWPSSTMCYYNIGNGSQCCSTLPVLVYQYPQTVNLELLHDGPLLEGQQYMLSCTVEKAAPVKHLIVEFLEGARLLAQYELKNSTEKKPADKVFMHSITASKENDGASYWCQTKLDLGPEGPLQPRVVTSGTVFTTVHYKPYLRGTSHSELISLTVGDPLHLNCSVEGNPSPLYTWTHPLAASSPIIGDVFSVASVTMEHHGQYICSASNSIGTTTVYFNVEVQANYMYIILAVAAVVVALVVLLFIIVYVRYYRLNKTGRYNLKDVFRFHQQHVALPDGEM